MIVKMNETVQGRDVEGELRHEGTRVKILERNEEYIVDVALGAWLVEHGKATDITPVKAESNKPQETPAPESDNLPSHDEQPVQHTKRGRK